MKTNIPLSSAKAAVPIQAAVESVRALRAKMVFLVALSDSERGGYKRFRLGPKSLRVLQSRVITAREHPELLPKAFDFEAFDNETASTAALDALLTEVNTLRRTVEDTLRVVGKSAIQSGNAVYGYLRISTSAGPADQLKSTVDKLAGRASRTRTPKNAAAAPSGTADPATANAVVSIRTPATPGAGNQSVTTPTVAVDATNRQVA